MEMSNTRQPNTVTSGAAPSHSPYGEATPRNDLSAILLTETILFANSKIRYAICGYFAKVALFPPRTDLIDLFHATPWYLDSF
jgi:hypothetical protein